MNRNSVFKKKTKISLLGKLAISLSGATLISLVIYIIINLSSNQVTAGPTQVNILELWNNGSYDEIIANGQEELKNQPLDPGILIFSGFAYFHKAVSESTVEKKTPLIDSAIFALRKALLISAAPLKPEIHYVLGKAYFHKGKFYADLAIYNLQEAVREGYQADDINEYLGLAYSVVSRYKDASIFFLKAVENKPSDGLLWTLGQTYYQMGDFEKSIVYIRQAIEKTKDRSLEQKCHFLLGDIFVKQKNYDLAVNEFDLILNKNPNSADAHYYLGEIYLTQGNKETARAEWRKAFKIDPLHFNANQRLFN